MQIKELLSLNYIKYPRECKILITIINFTQKNEIMNSFSYDTKLNFFHTTRVSTCVSFDSLKEFGKEGDRSEPKKRFL